jgi:hypothetical protein
MILFFLIALAVFFLALAVVFRRTLKPAESPEFVLEGPPMPREVAAAARRLELWRGQGRISREDYERLMHLCREDAGLSVDPGPHRK